MKSFMKKRLSVVSGSTASEFEENFNRTLDSIVGKEVKYDIQLFNNENGMSAYILYEEKVRIPECLKDEYELKGICYHCGDCPMFERTDKRSNVGKCERIGRGQPWATDDACPFFWKKLEEGAFNVVHNG